MDLLSVIRRWRFRQRMPIREIVRRTGLSRNTIRKYLRADILEPVFRASVRPGKLDPFAGAQADTTRPPSRKKSIGSSDNLDEAEYPARSETIREAFNTPFWPHLLATTSVGQEGLDFHIWCDRVVHWDLCSSPVDLEQREGRIQRFASLTIRRALALREGTAALAGAVGKGKSPWIEINRLAEQNHSDDAGLSPWWTLPNAHVRRYVFSLPDGRDALRFRKLQDQRFLYRLALGQPNPEDFLASLSNLGAAERLKPFLLNLSAFSRDQSEGDRD